MSDNWIVGMLQYTLSVWNDKLNEIWQLISQSSESFKGRQHLECYCKYKWCNTSNRFSIISYFLPSRSNKNLSEVLQK